MKVAMVVSAIVISAVSIGAQTSSAPPAQPATPLAPTVTLTGCVGGGINQQPFTLANAAMQPPSSEAPPPAAGVTPSSEPSPVLPPVSSPPTEPAGSGLAQPSASPTAGAVGTSGSTIPTYRLTGSDMSPWSGKRVQIVGTLAPAASGVTPLSAPGSVAALRELKVQSVQPAAGPCPK
jgi:hypothetical protein